MVCFDIPLLTFTIYNIILMLKEPGLNPVMFGTTLFWTAAGFAHLLSVTVSAARVTSAADDLPRMLLQPRIQQLMVGDVAETQGIVMVFNKYMDQHPPCFHVFHVKITNELVGTVLSLILGYVLVLATL